MLAKVTSQALFSQAFCALLEILCNQALRYNLHGNKPLNTLSDKTLAILLDELGFTLCFTICNENIIVTSQTEHYHCKVITSVNTLIELNNNEQSLTNLIKADQLDIEGDFTIAQRFLDFARSLNIDWQTELAKHIGDIPTYQLGKVGSALREKLRFAQQQISADATQWLVYEKRLCVTQGELTEFSSAVTQTAEQTTALEQRLHQLFNRNSQ